MKGKESGIFDTFNFFVPAPSPNQEGSGKSSNSGGLYSYITNTNFKRESIDIQVSQMPHKLRYLLKFKIYSVMVKYDLHFLHLPLRVTLRLLVDDLVGRSPGSCHLIRPIQRL